VHCSAICVYVLQDLIPSAALAAHSVMVNEDLYRELVSVTQQMEQLKLRHRLA